MARKIVMVEDVNVGVEEVEDRQSGSPTSFCEVYLMFMLFMLVGESDLEAHTLGPSDQVGAISVTIIIIVVTRGVEEVAGTRQLLSAAIFIIIIITMGGRGGGKALETTLIWVMVLRSKKCKTVPICCHLEPHPHHHLGVEEVSSRRQAAPICGISGPIPANDQEVSDATAVQYLHQTWQYLLERTIFSPLIDKIIQEILRH